MHVIRYPYMLMHCLSKLYVVILHLSYLCVGFDLELAKGSSTLLLCALQQHHTRLEVISPSSYFDSHLFNIDMYASL